MSSPNLPSLARGFTLLEAIVVIVITGIIYAIVAVFIKSPVDSNFYSARFSTANSLLDVPGKAGLTCILLPSLAGTPTAYSVTVLRPASSQNTESGCPLAAYSGLPYENR